MTVKSFEETYPRYPFAPLVAAGIAIARLIVRLRANQSPGAPASAPAHAAR